LPEKIHILGGGLAGCEAAWQVSTAGLDAVLYEMRPARSTPAHKTDRLGEGEVLMPFDERYVDRQTSMICNASVMVFILFFTALASELTCRHKNPPQPPII